MSLRISMDLDGVPEVFAWLEGTEARAESPLDDVGLMEPLEAAEARRFASFGGKYVLTGRVLESLTQPHANGAIRQVHGATADFGTRIKYAEYAQVRGGDELVVIDRRGQQQFVEGLMERIIG